MNDLLLGIRRIKRPAVAPADMQGALGAVEVSADLVLLGIVVSELAVLPGRGEAFELEHRHLRVRRIRGLLLLIQNDWTQHGTTTRGEDPLRPLFFRPPKHLIQPVHTPVTELPVAKVQPAAPGTWVQFLVKRTQRSRSAPHVPIESRWRLAVLRGRLLARSTARDKATNRSDVSHLAGLQKLMRLHMMRSQPTMQSYLHHLARRLRGVHHGTAFLHRVPRGLFDEHMRTRFERRDRRQRMPVVRRRDDDKVRLLRREQFAIVLVGFRFAAGQAFNFIR